VALHATTDVPGATDRARVLLISPDAPGPLDQGFRIRVHHLAVALAGAGFRVSLLAPAARPGDTAELEGRGVEVLPATVGGIAQAEGLSARIRRGLQLLAGRPPRTLAARVTALRPAIERLLAERSFDAVQVELPELVEAAAGRDVPVVLDAHNIWSELTARRQAIDPWAVRRAVRAIGHRRQRAAEERAWRSADLCLATSEREAGIISAAGARGVAMVPNGVATDTIRPVVGNPDAHDGGPPTLVFVGLLGYRPNADAVTHFVRDILPSIRAKVPDVHLQVIGDGATADLLRLAGPGVEFTGRVPDVRPFVTAAAVVVVPLRIGSGTRLKILEALALGRPVVTTAIGAEGLDVVDGEHVLIADEPSAFAAAVVRVLGDEGLAASLGQRGRALVEQSYDWSTVGSRLVAAYDQLLGRPA